jgi:hypothetical protein
MTKIAIIYYSSTGHTCQMARAISNIAWDAGEVLTRYIDDGAQSMGRSRFTSCPPVPGVARSSRPQAEHGIARSITSCKFATFNSRKSTAAGNLVPTHNYDGSSTYEENEVGVAGRSRITYRPSMERHGNYEIRADPKVSVLVWRIY